MARKRGGPRLDLEDKMLELIEKMGAVVEFNQRSISDRSEMKNSIEKLDSNIEGLRQAVNGLAQSISSTSTQVNALATEKCGERLSRLENLIGVDEYPTRLRRFENTEATVLRWKNLIGEGWSFAFRTLGALLASGAVAGAVVTFIRDHIH